MLQYIVCGSVKKVIGSSLSQKGKCYGYVVSARNKTESPPSTKRRLTVTFDAAASKTIHPAGTTWKFQGTPLRFLVHPTFLRWGALVFALQKGYTMIIDDYDPLRIVARFLDITGLERFFKLNALFAEITRLKTDSVMNLPVRVEWFRTLKTKLLQIYPCMKEWDTCDIRNLLYDLTNEKNTFEIGFFVVFGDVSYLALVNKLGGHLQGDRLLNRTAYSFVARQSASMMSGRYGGDEIVSLMTSVTDEAVRCTCEEIEQEISKGSYEIGGKTLIPYIDLGRAGLQEALFVLHTVISEGEEPEPGARISFMINSLIRIADQRADCYKRLRRIHLLVDLFINSRTSYNEFINYMRKGTGNISDEQVENLAEIRKTKSDEGWREYAVQYILTHLTKDTGTTLRERVELEVALKMFV